MAGSVVSEDLSVPRPTPGYDGDDEDTMTVTMTVMMTAAMTVSWAEKSSIVSQELNGVKLMKVIFFREEG